MLGIKTNKTCSMLSLLSYAFSEGMIHCSLFNFNAELFVNLSYVVVGLIPIWKKIQP